jgi:putative ABC transport system permease protein
MVSGNPPRPRSMRAAEAWKLAWDALRANKLRAFLTVLGVVIGSGCIVLVVTVALTSRRYIIAQIEGVGSNLVYAQLVSTGHPIALSDMISLGDMRAVRAAVPQVVEVAGTHDIPMTVVAGGVVYPVALVGITTGFRRIRNLLILHGRYFDATDMESHAKVCLLTDHLAGLVFPVGNPVGQSIRVGDLSFTVIGVFRERVTTLGQSEVQRDSVLVPFGLIRDYTGADVVKTLYVQADGPQDVPIVTREVAEVLRSRHRGSAEYNVQNLSSILEAARSISRALTAILLVIASIALIISGIGIMNIMLVTVTERTQEIGIRKALGARRREILVQFLGEAFLISGGGALIGVLLAASVPVFTQPLLPSDVHVTTSWLSVAAAFGVSCLTGVLFGYLPADRAARLQPTEALRYE